MLEALGFAVQMFFTGSLILGAVYFIHSWFTEPRIPQDEIDAEARRLIVEHGAGAITAAEGHVQRAQWAKGKNDSMERTGRVLKAVRRSLKGTQ